MPKDAVICGYLTMLKLFWFIALDEVRALSFRILAPTGEKVVFDTQIIENLTDGLIDDILNRFRLVIKTGDRRQNMCAHVGR